MAYSLEEAFLVASLRMVMGYQPGVCMVMVLPRVKTFTSAEDW